MATKGMVSVKNNFALLKVEDDDDSDQEGLSKQSPKNQQQNTPGKKRNKKKKKADIAAENAQLRNMAFGQSKGANRPPSNGRKSSGDVKNPSNAQWEQWKKMDAEFTADTYEQELQQAILQSKLEFEEKKEVLEAVPNGDSGKSGGKDKKKKKKGTMSLEEFNQMPPEKPKDDSEGEDYEFMPVTKIETKIDNPDPKFFDNVKQDAQQMIRKEIIQEEYRKQYSLESAQAVKHQEEIEKRDEEIKRLQEENKKLKDEHKEVKKRNKQLCHILAQGEMKDKQSVLLENEELKEMQQELTQEVTDLTSELEKERSTVHSMREELNKAKGGKQSSR